VKIAGGQSYGSLARAYGVSLGTIQGIAHGKTWVWLDAA
jgi:hypothetical protein